jgi:ribokinase
MKVLNFGSLNLDYVYSVDTLVKAGETISSKDFNIEFGGKGLNQSIALAKAGISVYHAGVIGKNGIILKDFCKANNVNTEHVKIVDKQTGHAIIQIDNKAENSIILYKGANFEITKEYVDEVFLDFREGDYIILQNEINMVDYIIEEAHKKGMIVVFNPAPITEAVKDINLEYVNYLIVNETEAFSLTGEEDVEKSARILKKLYENTFIAITLGSKGLIYIEKNETIKIEANKVKAVDTTAAGDTFIGYFVAMILKGFNRHDSLKLANKASAIKVTRKGSAKMIPTIKEVLDFNF